MSDMDWERHYERAEVVEDMRPDSTSTPEEQGLTPGGERYTFDEAWTDLLREFPTNRDAKIRGLLHKHRAAVEASLPEPASPEAPGSGLDARQFAEELVAEIGSMRAMQSWSQVETEARRSAYDDVLAVISDRLAARPDGAEADASHEHGPLSWTNAGWRCDVCGAVPVAIKP